MGRETERENVTSKKEKERLVCVCVGDGTVRSLTLERGLITYSKLT